MRLLVAIHAVVASWWIAVVASELPSGVPPLLSVTAGVYAAGMIAAWGTLRAGLAAAEAELAKVEARR